MTARTVGMLFLVSLLIAEAGIAGGIEVTRFDDPVPNGCMPADCSLREAIIAANSSPQFNALQLPAGTFTLSLPDTGPNTAVDGDLDIFDELVINGAGAGVTIIDGGGVDRVFDIAAGAFEVEIRDLTIYNGDANSGGGVLNAGSLDLVNCEIRGNHADNGGGGVFNHQTGVLGVSNCRLISNEAMNAAGGGSGGALSNSGVAYIEYSVLDDNWAEFTGGAVAVNDVSPPAQTTIESSIISNNTANTDMQWWGGGGIINFGELTVWSSSIVGNGADNSDGGGLNNWSQATLVNVTLSGNSAASEGGAIRNTSGTTNVVAGTLVDNTALDAGGAFGLVLFMTSIVADNPGGNCTQPASGGDCDYPSLDSENSCDFCPQFVNLDPLLGPLADNGGATPTHALLAGSPAIDGADSAMPGGGCPYFGGPSPLSIDQRGFPRPFDGDEDDLALCDLGAFEFGDPDIFADGFESGDTSIWSITTP